MAYDFLVLNGIVDDYPDDLPGWQPSGVSPDGRYVVSSTGGFYKYVWILDRMDDTYVATIDSNIFLSINNITVDTDGTSVYYIPSGDPVELYYWPDILAAHPTTPIFSCPSNTTAHPNSMRMFTMPDNSRKIVWLMLDNVDNPDDLIYYYDPATDVGTAVTWTGAGLMGAVQDSYGDVWVFGRENDANVMFKRVIDGGAGTAAPDVNVFAIPHDPSAGIEIQAVHTSAGWLVIANGGQKIYLLSDVDFSTITSIDYSASLSTMGDWSYGASENIFLMTEPGLTQVWLPGPVSFADYQTTGTVSDLVLLDVTDLSTIATIDIRDWTVDDFPSNENTPPIFYSSYAPKAFISLSVSNADPLSVADRTPVIRYLPDLGDGGGGGLTDEDVRLRVWKFSLDNHDFYVLRLGPDFTLVYDLTTRTWSQWKSPFEDVWRAHVGQNWVGIGSTTSAAFNTDIIAGDDRSGILWIVDPETGLDDSPTDGQDPLPYQRKVTGGVQASSRGTRPNGAAELTASVGNPEETGATFRLEYSDDFGNTWVDCGTVEVPAGNFNTIVEWRALGLIKHPGRVFRITDQGAAARISRLDLR